MKFLMAMLSLSLIINVSAMERDKDVREGAVDLLFLNPGVQINFYKSLLDALENEQEQLKKEADTLQLQKKIACRGCGEEVLSNEKITHLTFQCKLGKLLSKEIKVSEEAAEELSTKKIKKGQKIKIVECEVCGMSMPKDIYLLHQVDRCAGPEYRVKEEKTDEVKRVGRRNPGKVKSKRQRIY